MKPIRQTSRDRLWLQPSNDTAALSRDPEHIGANSALHDEPENAKMDKLRSTYNCMLLR